MFFLPFEVQNIGQPFIYNDLNKGGMTVEMEKSLLTLKRKAITA